MNTCEQSLVEKKNEKSVTDIRKKKQKKGAFLVNDIECFALSDFIFTNQN